MNTVTAKQLKTETGKVLQRVMVGETVLILRRGRLIGKIVPVEKGSVIEELAGILEGIDLDASEIRAERLRDKCESS